MKRLLTVLVACALLTACGSRISYEQHTTPDGRKIECFVYHRGYKGGLSCNWPGRP